MHINSFWILPTVTLTEPKSCFCNFERHVGKLSSMNRLARAALFMIYVFLFLVNLNFVTLYLSELHCGVLFRLKRNVHECIDCNYYSLYYAFMNFSFHSLRYKEAW